MVGLRSVLSAHSVVVLLVIFPNSPLTGIVFPRRSRQTHSIPLERFWNLIAPHQDEKMVGPSEEESSDLALPVDLERKNVEAPGHHASWLRPALQLQRPASGFFRSPSPISYIPEDSAGPIFLWKIRENLKRCARVHNHLSSSGKETWLNWFNIHL